MRDDVIELDFIVTQMAATFLASVIISAHNAHLHRKGNVPSAASELGCLRNILADEDDGTDVSEDVALHVFDFRRNPLWSVLRVERGYFSLKGLAPLLVQGAPVV